MPCERKRVQFERNLKNKQKTEDCSLLIIFCYKVKSGLLTICNRISLVYASKSMQQQQRGQTNHLPERMVNWKTLKAQGEEKVQPTNIYIYIYFYTQHLPRLTEFVLWRNILPRKHPFSFCSKALRYAFLFVAFCEIWI